MAGATTRIVAAVTALALGAVACTGEDDAVPETTTAVTTTTQPPREGDGRLTIGRDYDPNAPLPSVPPAPQTTDPS